jgi:hypothetical protein
MMRFSVSNFDRHLTNEQLSALLDDQFLPNEPVEEYREHLRFCSQCQSRLEDLRQTVTLLHALPQPTLPRSFTLPVETTTPQPSTSRTQEASPLPTTPAPIISLADRRRKRGRFLPAALRAVAVLVAAIGVLLMLSGLLLPLPGASNSAATTSANSGSSSTSGSTSSSQPAHSNAQPDTTATPPSGRMITTPRPAEIKPQPTAQPKSQSPPANNTTASPPLLTSLNTMGNRIGLGILLFFLGAICFTLLRQR